MTFKELKRFLDSRIDKKPANEPSLNYNVDKFSIFILLSETTLSLRVMTKLLSCREVGRDSDYIVTGETEEAIATSMATAFTGVMLAQSMTEPCLVIV